MNGASRARDFAELIRRKRDGESLDAAAIEDLVAQIADDTASEGQLAAFAMAVYFQGLDRHECAALTLAMAGSGEVVDWRGTDLPGPRVDKHSSGGVGDKVSLLLAPMLAACGAFVPMISGRGLGHTGGTLDKLESIPGYQVKVDAARLRAVTAAAGCAIVGATRALAPADRRLYAVRDVTATVDSLPLITASILSKKLAAGLDALVMDVKCGNGAFAVDRAAADALASSIVAVARGAGLPTEALVTDMNQVLGWSAGNALEVGEAIAALRGEACEPRLLEVTLALGQRALQLSGVQREQRSARAALEQSLRDGSAAERFAAMVGLLGGPRDLLERPAKRLPRAPVLAEVEAPRAGFVAGVDTRAVGRAVVRLGGGRQRPQDRIDARVGLSSVAGIGEAVGAGRPLAIVHAADAAAAKRAATALRAAVTIADEAPSVPPAVLD